MATVLIVEDSPSMRAMVREALEQGGHQVCESEDGPHALAVLPSVAPDVVITDVNMPKMDGLALVRAIREMPRFRFTPILVLSTEKGDELKSRGREAGATGWIAKPFHPDRLCRALQTVLGR